ncbi:MAG: cytochrome c oxidase subunit II [Candidatus Dormiibacterota bacterium]
MSHRPLGLTRVALLASTAAALAVVVFSGTANAAFGGLDPVVPSGVSPNGQDEHFLYLLISIPAIVVFVGVEALLVTIIIKWRRSKLPADYRPPQWHGHTTLEITWTVIPFLILLFVGGASFHYMQLDLVKPAASQSSIAVHIIAHQYGWDYHYTNGVVVSSNGLTAAQDPLVVPEGQLVRIQLDSEDVIHSFWVPDITGKTDAVPGYSNYTWMKIDQLGEWRGECAELCGTGHATMQIRVKSVPTSDFQVWLQQQKKQQSQPSPSPSASGNPTPPASSPSPSSGASPSPGASASPSPSAKPGASPSASPSPSPSS